jgi:hypothetical protein
MTGSSIFEIWVVAFFTLALFSFLYKDNPIYKVAEHIFAGLTAGYQVGLIWDTVILQKLWDPMLPDSNRWPLIYISNYLDRDWLGAAGAAFSGSWWLFLPGLLGLLMFARFFSKYSWLSRTPLAVVFAVTAGVFLTTQLHGLVLPQMQSTMRPITRVVDFARSPYTENPGVFTIVDSVGTTPEDTVGTEGPLEATQVDTTDQSLPAFVPGSLTLDSTRFPVGSTDSIQIQFQFRDRPSLGFGRFHAVDISLRPPKSKAGNLVAARDVVSNDGIAVTDDGRGLYTVSYVHQLTGDEIPGPYDISMRVERRSIRFALTAVVVIGVLSTLIYFYFSHEHAGVLGVTARIGVWFIMVAFGAHFGYTVMGRVSLLIGRVQFLIEDWIGSFTHIF